MHSDLPKMYVDLYNRVARVRRSDKMIPVTGGPPLAAASLTKVNDRNSDLLWSQNSNAFAKNLRWAWRTSWKGFWQIWREWFVLTYGVRPGRHVRAVRRKILNHPAWALGRSFYLAWWQRNTPVGLIEAAELKRRFRKK